MPLLTVSARRTKLALSAGLFVPVVAVSSVMLIPGADASPAPSNVVNHARIISSQSNLLPAGSPSTNGGGVATPTVAGIIGPEPPKYYRVYESHYYSAQTCAAWGKNLVKWGTVEKYWCTKKKQTNGKYWLYVYGTCHTDVIPADSRP